MSILKEGFLQKRGEMLLFPGWKKKHCMLRSDGEFLIGDGKHVQFKFNTKIDLKKIEVGFEVASVNLPRGNSEVEAMFVLFTKHKTVYLLAGSSLECREWVGSIQNSKTKKTTAAAPPHTMGHPSPHHSAPSGMPNPSYGASAPPPPAYNPNYTP